MNIGSSLLDIGYSIALPQVETCLSQKPLFTQAGDNLEIRKAGRKWPLSPLTFPDVPDFLIQPIWSSFDFDSDAPSNIQGVR